MARFVKHHLVFLILFLGLGGCSTTNIPHYIRSESPYRHKFYGNYEDVVKVAQQALAERGWIITKQSDPALYDMSMVMDNPDGEQVLIFTDLKPLAFLLGSRYSRINLYLRTGMSNTVDAEIRYIKVTRFPLKTFRKYRNDKEVEGLFDLIETKLHQR